MLGRASIRAELDSRAEPLAARVRDSELEKVPYVLVLGDREIAEGSVSVRTRGSSESRSLPLSEWMATLY
jgi:threonyl-tRNA synthetase